MYLAAFVAADQARSIRPGQAVHIASGHIAPQRWGFVLGEVHEVGQYPATLEQITSVLKNPDLTRMIQGNGVMTYVQVLLMSAPENPGEPRWTGKPPENATLSPGTMCTVSFITEQRAPIFYVMPWIREKILGQKSVSLVLDAPLGNRFSKEGMVQVSCPNLKQKRKQTWATWRRHPARYFTPHEH